MGYRSMAGDQRNQGIGHLPSRGERGLDERAKRNEELLPQLLTTRFTFGSLVDRCAASPCTLCRQGWRERQERWSFRRLQIRKLHPRPDGSSGCSGGGGGGWAAVVAVMAGAAGGWWVNGGGGGSGGSGRSEAVMAVMDAAAATTTATITTSIHSPPLMLVSPSPRPFTHRRVGRI